MTKIKILKYPYFALILLLVSCIKTKEEKAVALYDTYCSSCHLLPEINSLPKHIWEEGVLPDMAARMGIQDSTYDPYEKVSRMEKFAIMESGIYPKKPIIETEDWNLLKDYILKMANDSLDTSDVFTPIKKISQFHPQSVILDSTKGALITFLEYDSLQKKIVAGNLNGKLIHYDPLQKKVIKTERTENALTAYAQKDTLRYLTYVGYLNPSELASGSVHVIEPSKRKLNKVGIQLHRPVHTLVYDFNEDGNDEVVVCEFGDLTGKLSLLSHTGDFEYQREVLLNQPGSIRTIAKDMNKDGKTDIVVLTSQGREGITILYQEDNLEFKMETPIKFSPVYGSSWFEIIDYNHDGFYDIVTVHGDNADKSYVHKPYHGLRLHINDGNNNFEDKYFYPLNGATRVVSNDFDQDGDIDFGILSTFPNYEQKPTYSFVYLQNNDADLFNFEPYRLNSSDLGRWLLMDSGDFDDDGDIDIVLSAFSYSFTPVPKNLHEAWRNSDVDLLILENNLNPAVPNP
ncbi:VCBS repeat-containing protein [Maribacter sp. PR1]|uniref:VCBS repeat-containing protein n=1 Tax=Maribacter cobaltidurans TaxID=1178778 RepID=A0ABU7IWN0_9FLAO|nr:MULTISPECIES: VCBS repeat-containing protein [Maribacter]MDC6389811.1 VCBS repeat-containing protein [Maribacter sp. PR1]MEE1977201.1 VCBS repeat-containing protein [Maribacter cobaltidurans]